MKGIFIVIIAFLGILLEGCAPLETIVSHDFASGYFKMKTQGEVPSKVYVSVNNDSLVVYPLREPDLKEPETEMGRESLISKTEPGSFLYRSTFSKVSVDADLSTVITRLRPPVADVPVQLSSTINAIVYLGTRKDFYIVRSNKSALNYHSTFIRHLGYDAGFFAGIGITPVNPTVTINRTSLEYDGVVFQKGIAAFVTLDHLSLGLALGFDNLIGGDADIWIYNNKPWIGLVLGIANF